MEETREQKVAKAMKDAALKQIQRARESDETDMRQVRSWIEALKVDEVIASVK